MPKFQISLEDFTFPDSLDHNKANFRFALDLRYFDSKGNPATGNTALPSLESYYECDWQRAADYRFVGATDPTKSQNKNKPDNYGRVDPNRLNEFAKVAFLVNAASLHSMNLTAFDVDRKDFWDGFLKQLSGVADRLLGTISEELPSSFQISDSLKSVVTRKITGPSDRIVGTQGFLFSGQDPSYTILLKVGEGDYAGDYSFTFSVLEIS